MKPPFRTKAIWLRDCAAARARPSAAVRVSISRTAGVIGDFGEFVLDRADDDRLPDDAFHRGADQRAQAARDGFRRARSRGGGAERGGEDDGHDHRMTPLLDFPPLASVLTTR